MTKKSSAKQKLYRNEGVSELVLEGEVFEPGSEFRATLTPEHETQLLGGGHIVILEDQSTAADEAQASAADTGDTDTNASTEPSTRRKRESRS